MGLVVSGKYLVGWRSFDKLRMTFNSFEFLVFSFELKKTGFPPPDYSIRGQAARGQVGVTSTNSVEAQAVQLDEVGKRTVSILQKQIPCGTEVL